MQSKHSDKLMKCSGSILVRHPTSLTPNNPILHHPPPARLPPRQLLAQHPAQPTLHGLVIQLTTPDEFRGHSSAVDAKFVISGPMLAQFESGLVAGLFTPGFLVVKCSYSHSLFSYRTSVTPMANSDSSLGSVKSQKPPGNRQLALSYHAEELGGQSSYHWPHRYTVLASPHQIDG